MKSLKSISIIIFNTFILLTLIEIVLRITFPREETTEELSIAYQHDPNYLVSIKPGIKKKFMRSIKNGGDTITWKTNKHGFRGDDIIKKDITIAVYGDSNIQARFSSLENTYAKRLEQYLLQKGHNSISVINAGIVGHGPDQSFLKFKKEKNSIQPNIVILNIFADNDYGDLLRNKLIKLDDKNNINFNSYQKSIDPIFSTTKKNVPKWYRLRIYDAIRKLRTDYIRETSLLPENIIQTYARVCQEEFESYNSTNDSIYSNFADHYDLDIAVNPESESSRLKIKLMEAILTAFNNFTEENAIEFIVLIQPSAIDINKNYVLNFDDILKRCPTYKSGNLTSIVHTICKKNQIKTINLYDTFVKDNPDTYYFTDLDNHWNDLGQDKAAKITSEFLLEQILPSLDTIHKKL